MEHKADEALIDGKTGQRKGLWTTTGACLYAMAWIITLAAAFAGLEPLLLVGLMLAYTLLAAFCLLKSGTFWRSYNSTDPLFLTLLAFAAYVLLSALWSITPLLALEKSALIILLVLGIRFTFLLLEQISELQVYQCARGILFGLLFGISFAAIEYATDYLILNSARELFPGLVKIPDGATRIPSWHLNTNVTAMMLFLWPALLATLAWQDQRLKKWLLAALLATTLLLLYKTQSATARMVFALAAPAAFVAFSAPRYVDRMARILWIIAVLGAVPLVVALHYAGLQNSKFMPYSFRDRIHIWNYTARLVPQNPLLGIGIRSSRSYKKQPRPNIPSFTSKKLVDHQGWHSHNMFVQTWYELGAIGAAFLLAIGLLLLRAINSIEAKTRPFAYAVFASFSVVAAFGYGMWQSWLLATYGWSVIFTIIVLKYNGNYSDRQNPEPHSPAAR